ncbi:ABC transporter permease [Treponema primitia]|nr:ABC transporter permease [Treponema primitia]
MKRKKLEEQILAGDIQHTGYYKDAFMRLKKNKIVMACLIFIGLLVLSALLAPVIAPHDPDEQNYEAVLQKASPRYLLGADEFGRDILSRIIYGGRVSFSVGLLTQLFASLIGITLGAIAGYNGGWIDAVISRIMEIFSAFPDLLLAMGIMFVIGPGVANVFIALALLSWVSIARLIRGQVLQLKETEYIEAARVCGASGFWIILKHMLPNCVSTIIVMVTLGIPNAIMSEASLSFLGLGIQPPIASWGAMISAAQPYIGYRPWYSIFPGIAIILTVIAFNIFGDGLRDALDPKLRN